MFNVQCYNIKYMIWYTKYNVQCYRVHGSLGWLLVETNENRWRII